MRVLSSVDVILYPSCPVSDTFLKKTHFRMTPDFSFICGAPGEANDTRTQTRYV